MLDMNLTEWDKEKLRVIRLENDLMNLKALLLGEPLSSHGNFDEGELEDILLAKEELPDFVIEFLNEYDSKEDRIKYFSKLMSDFYRVFSSRYLGFLHKYFSFERKLRLSLVALRSKYAKLSLEKQLQFEEPTDPFVAFLLAQKDSENLELDSEFAGLKEIFNENIENPLRLQKAILEYRMHFLEEVAVEHPFSIDEILGYYIRLLIVENWQKLNAEEGKNQLDQLVRE
jgi:hypothetical protein